MDDRIVDKVKTVDQLEEAFAGKIDSIDVCVGLLGLGGEEPAAVASQTKERLLDMCHQIAHLRSCIAAGRRNLESAKYLLPAIKALNSRLGHMRDNLPSRLPSQQDDQSRQNVQQDNEPKQRPLPNLQGIKTENNAVPNETSTVKNLLRNPTFQYITTQEFEDVPKYVRGRLQYDQVNRFVDHLNETLTSKYKLFRKPRSKLTLPEMKLVNILKGQKNSNTEGRVFVCSDDLKRWSSAKIADNSTRSILNVLRVARKSEEIRGPGNLLRYAVPKC